MKKLSLIITLIGSASFSSIAAGMPTLSKANSTTQVSVLSVENLNNTLTKSPTKCTDCGWVNIQSSCGTLAHAYVCNMDQVIQRINDMEEDCDNL